MIILLNKLKDYDYFKVKSVGSKDWYKVVILDGVPLCWCSLKYNRSITTKCKHIKEVLDNYKLL